MTQCLSINRLLLFIGFRIELGLLDINVQGYGMTESSGCLTFTPPALSTYAYGHTVGTLLANTSLKILDDDGKELGIDQPGEVRISAPCQRSPIHTNNIKQDTSPRPTESNGLP